MNQSSQAGNPGPGVWSPVRNAVRAAVTLPLFVGDHAWRNRIIERSEAHVETLSEPPPPESDGPGVQHRADGTGPIMMRTYRVDIVTPVLDAPGLLTEFRADPNRFVSGLVAGWVRDDQPAHDVQVGDDVVVELPGPWNGPSRVVHVDDVSVMLATLDGHMEAGHIRFRVIPTDDGYTYEVRSWARSGDPGAAFLHLIVPVGTELQTAMWCASCERAVAVSGGTRRGPIRADTEILSGSDVDERSSG